MLMTPIGTRNFGHQEGRQHGIGVSDLVSFNRRLLEISRSHFNDTPSASVTPQRDRIAGAVLDKGARAILSALDNETSLRWGDLGSKIEQDWPEICKAIGLLTWAGICSPGPTRIRLTEMGVRILDGSPTPWTTRTGIEQA